MAVITLQPGESFEHYHLEKSETYYVNGEVQLTFEGKSMLLTDGHRVIIPAKTSHTTKNIGVVVAQFGCNHTVYSPDEESIDEGEGAEESEEE